MRFAICTLPQDVGLPDHIGAPVPAGTASAWAFDGGAWTSLGPVALHSADSMGPGWNGPAWGRGFAAGQLAVIDRTPGGLWWIRAIVGWTSGMDRQDLIRL